MVPEKGPGFKQKCAGGAAACFPKADGAWSPCTYVADVYDALVSKRVYKEPMSFEQAARIMQEGMGTQFDPNMLLVFLSCLEKLEQYYTRERH